MQIPYMFPLFLGMAFDARTLRPGPDLFEDKYVDDPGVIPFGQFKSVYKVVTSQSEVQEALDIDGDLSLKIKSGLVNVKGKGSYIKNEETDENKISILISSEYISVVKYFKQGAKPRKGWQDLIYNSHNEHTWDGHTRDDHHVLATHYVKEVTYGAEFIADVKFIILNSNDTTNIKAEIKASLTTEGNSTDLFVNGTIDLLKKKLSGKVNVEISYYATVPIASVPTTLKGLEELIESFPDQYGKTEYGQGAPLSVSLEPVSTLFEENEEYMKDQFRFQKNEELQSALNEFGEKFQELRQVRLDLHAWSKALPFDISPSLKSEIGKLHKQIMDALEAFFETLWHLDVTHGPEQLNKAMAMYDPDGTYKYHRYISKMNQLKSQYDSSNILEEVSGATYMRWGNDKCPDADSYSVAQGVTYSSSENGIGGVSKYDCADNSVHVAEDLVNLPEDDPTTHLKSEIAIVRYPEVNSRHTPFVGKEAKKVSGKGIPCSKCHNPYLATVTTFPGKSQCPITWKLVYKGYLVSSRADLGQTTEYICLDEEPSTPIKVEQPYPHYESVAFTTVNSQGALPSNNYKKGPLRCVVCSINMNLKLFFKADENSFQ